MAHELVIRNAQLRRQQGLVDIGIDQGLIKEIGAIKDKAASTIDAGGGAE